jgi:hypothetical protein
LSLIGTGQLEADLDLPVAEGDTIALALSWGGLSRTSTTSRGAARPVMANCGSA